MSRQMTFEGFRSATGSPEGEFGASPSAAPGGETSVQSGLPPAPARASRSLAKERDLATLATSGRIVGGSSKSAALQWSLENKLAQRLDTGGSILYRMTWRRLVTPLGLPYFRLAASGHRINVSDFIGLGWPTPAARDWKSGEAGTETLEGNARPLSEIAVLAGWVTPNTPNGGRISGNAEDIGKKRNGTKAQIGLENQAVLSGWNTPRANDGEKQGEVSEDLRNGLVNDAKLAGWDSIPEWMVFLAVQGTVQSMTLSELLERLGASGMKRVMFSLGPNGWAIRRASGQLNPAHSLWLMGLPDEYISCVSRAMQSYSPKRKRGSKS